MAFSAVISSWIDSFRQPQQQLIRQPIIFPGKIVRQPIDFNQLILEEAKKWVDKEGYGGTYSRCNEWVQRLFKDAGIPLGNYKNANNFEDHVKLALTVAKSGVVVQFDRSGMGKGGHVAVMLDDRRFISTNSSNTIKIYNSFESYRISPGQKGLEIRYLEYNP